MIVTCPECDKKLKLAALKSGQRVRCPNCDKVFAPEAEEEQRPEAVVEKAEAKRPPRSPLDFSEDDEDERPRRKRSRDDDEEEERPRSRRSRDDEDDDDEDERPLRKKKGRKRGGFPWILVGSIGGGLAAVLIVVFVFFNPFESDLSKAEKITRKALKAANEVADALQNVTDDASARTAASKIEKLADEIESLAKKKDTIKLSPEDQKVLQERLKPEMDKMQQRARPNPQLANFMNKDPLRSAMQRLRRAGPGGFGR